MTFLANAVRSPEGQQKYEPVDPSSEPTSDPEFVKPPSFFKILSCIPFVGQGISMYSQRAIADQKYSLQGSELQLCLQEDTHFETANIVRHLLTEALLVSSVSLAFFKGIIGITAMFGILFGGSFLLAGAIVWNVLNILKNSEEIARIGA